MNSFLFSFDATTTITGATPPTLEVLVGGVVVSSVVMEPGATSYDVFVDYTGATPSSVTLRFAGSSGSPGDSISITSASINDGALNLGTDLTATLLMQSQTSGVSGVASLYGHTTPTVGVPTISGTGGDDDIKGRDNADIIDGMAGNDRLLGYDNDDTINGGDGDDYIFGQNGNDTILGGAGNDVLFGNDDNDVLFGEGDNDYLIGGNGDDILNGGAGTDALLGDAGNDVLFGEGGDDWLVGDAGDDILFGDDGNDVLNGGADNDALSGGLGDDQLVGGDGDDLLAGNDGADVITGDAGADWASGGAGDDEIYGGDGNDELSGGDDDDYVSGDDGDDEIYGDDGDDVLVGGAGADTMYGGAGNDILHGHGLDSAAISTILYNNPNVVYSQETGSFYQYVSTAQTWTNADAAAQAATLNGNAGHLVTITSQAENDFITNLISNNIWVGANDEAQEGTWQWLGGIDSGMQFWSGLSGGSLLGNMYENWNTGEPNEYGSGEDYLEFRTDSLWNDNGGPNQPALTNGYVIEWEAGLMGDDGANDILSGGSGDDWLYGYDGDDTIDGEGDNDTIIGGAGSDTLSGSAGNDVIYAYDATVETAAAITAGATVTILDEAFGTNTGVFSYSDGGFGGSDGPNVDVSGTRDTGDGGIANGSLQVYVDGQNNSSFTNGSGSWDATVSHTTDLTNVQITFSYRHWHANQNDTGEDSQVWFEFNGTTYDASGGNSFISEALGSGGTTDTGWVTVTIDLPDLTASTSYNLSMGILHLGSNRNNEDAYVRFDDITITGDEPGVSGTTTNSADIGETNIVHGGSGDDLIYGSAGTDTLYGDDGSDTIYSASANEAWDTAVANVLSSNAGVVYSADTNSFYQVVSSTTTWTSANSTANSSTLTGLSGVNGHLATITSQAEQTFLEGQTGGNSSWLGGGDFGTEGVWTWTAGPEAGAQFANSSGAAVNGWYNSWTGGQPNDSDGTQDYLYMLNGTDWADLVVQGDGSTGYVTVPQYIIEWDATALISTVDYTTIDGGAGNDTLYANDGIDVFVYDSATWSGSGDVDTIENFSATGHDSIDISDLLTGYSYTGSDINDFVQLNESGGNTTIAVDANGTTGGSSYVAVATLNGVTGLDLHQMISADNLVV